MIFHTAERLFIIKEYCRLNTVHGTLNLQYAQKVQHGKKKIKKKNSFSSSNVCRAIHFSVLNSIVSSFVRIKAVSSFVRIKAVSPFKRIKAVVCRMTTNF